MDFLKEIKDFRILIGSIVAIIVFSITSYEMYNNIYIKMYNNNKQIELTLLTIIKEQIRSFEAATCKTSRDSWAEYNMLLSQYYIIKKKHNPALKDLNIKPIERLAEDSCKCYNGEGECNE